MNHTSQTFVMLYLTFLCNITEFHLFDFSFHCCAIFYFCTVGQINECVHSCVTFYFVITYQVERQLNFR